MKKTIYILIFILCSLSLISLVPDKPANNGKATKNKTDKDKEFTIEPHCKWKVKNRIGKKIDTWKDDTPLYKNKIIMNLYENDTLIYSIDEQDNIRNIFNSYYLWIKDTLYIHGNYGLPAAEGFMIRIVKNDIQLYHTLYSRDIYPKYAYHPTGDAEWWIGVKCVKSKIVLSNIPNLKEKRRIYGYVDFKTEDYYECNLDDKGKEIPPRRKQRKEMKIYFLADFYKTID